MIYNGELGNASKFKNKSTIERTGALFWLDSFIFGLSSKNSELIDRLRCAWSELQTSLVWLVLQVMLVNIVQDVAVDFTSYLIWQVACVNTLESYWSFIMQLTYQPWRLINRSAVKSADLLATDHSPVSPELPPRPLLPTKTDRSLVSTWAGA